MKTVFDELISGKRKNFHETYQIHWHNDREYEWIDKQGAIFEYDEKGKPKTIIGINHRNYPKKTAGTKSPAC